MTKHHTNQLAAELKKIKRTLGTDYVPHCYKVAAILAKINPRFKLDEFIEACGAK